MKTCAIVLALVVGLGTAREVSSGEIVKRDVYYYASDSTASQYVFQGDKRKNARNSRYYATGGLLPRYRPVRSNAGVRYPYGYEYSHYVPPHCAYPITYRSRGMSAWFYPGGCRTVVRVSSPVVRR